MAEPGGPRGPVAHPLFIVGGGGGAWPTHFLHIFFCSSPQRLGHVGGLPLHVLNINVEKI